MRNQEVKINAKRLVIIVTQNCCSQKPVQLKRYSCLKPVPPHPDGVSGCEPSPRGYLRPGLVRVTQGVTRKPRMNSRLTRNWYLSYQPRAYLVSSVLQTTLRVSHFLFSRYGIWCEVTTQVSNDIDIRLNIVLR